MDTPQTTVHSKVETALHLSPHFRHQPVNVSSEGQSVCLRGRVRSFFEKQMAQEVAQAVEGVEGVENELTVVWQD